MEKSINKYAYFAGGCFWGVEYFFEKLDGVKSAVSGYMGGSVDTPTYREVCSGMTGHLEVVRVEYDPSIVSYESLVKLFFEIHDFEQTNGQGPDIGPQYLSAIFFNDKDEEEICDVLIKTLEHKGFEVATKLILAQKHSFYMAEDYHQDYYFKEGKIPYCHSRKRIF